MTPKERILTIRLLEKQAQASKAEHLPKNEFPASNISKIHKVQVRKSANHSKNNKSCVV